MLCASTAYSGVCFLGPNGGSRSQLQWWCNLKTFHLHYGTALKGKSWRPNALVFFCQKFWHQPSTNFVISKNGMHNCMAWPEPWMISNCAAVPLIVDLSSSIMALASSCLSSLVDVDRYPQCSESVTINQPFSNASNHSYALSWGNTLSPYWADKCLWISNSFIPCTHKNQISPLFFLGAINSGTAIFRVPRSS